MTNLRPEFVDKINDSYNNRRKNAIVLTGNIRDIFWSESADDFISLDRLLYSELSSKFNLMTMTMSGLVFDNDESGVEIIRVCKESDANYPEPLIGDLKRTIGGNVHSPLANLETIKLVAEAFVRLRATKKKLEQTNGTKAKIISFKPLCVVINHSGALFPAGTWNSLSELDRQRLTLLLSWFTEPRFIESDELIILVNRVKTEMNSEITSLPNVAHVEISMPGDDERSKFTELFVKTKPVSFEKGQGDFVKSTAGLTVSSAKDLLEVAKMTGNPIAQKQVLEEVNTLLRAQLGDIISIKHPEHRPSDIIGYKATTKVIAETFERCEDSETAVSAILVSGPNGGGKTYQLEAFAGDSGRIVVELTGLRSSLFGETDAFFEKLRFYLTTLGKVLILVDEAHTAFGSVHGSDTHETEKRLSGNIIKMMGNPSLRGKILWALMTSRPDELDPDVKSRAPVQIPIFDLVGDERQQFVGEMFRRKKIVLGPVELVKVMEETSYYSARDYDNLLREVQARRKKEPEVQVPEVLKSWSASKSIIRQRQFQRLIAAMHCSYPQLLPEDLKDGEKVSLQADALKLLLYR